MRKHCLNVRFPSGQRGAAVIEFALIAVIFFMLLFGVIEFGRLLFTINSAQEVTRRAAREQVVRWVAEATVQDVQRKAVLRSGDDEYFPGSPDIHITNVRLSFFNSYSNAVIGANPISGVSNPMENFNNCYWNEANCIRFVRAELAEGDGSPVTFTTLVPFLPETFVLPRSTVIMPAEALGLQ